MNNDIEIIYIQPSKKHQCPKCGRTVMIDGEWVKCIVCPKS